MSRDAKHAAAWRAEGKEAEAILTLARSVESAGAVDEQAAKARFLRELRQHVERSDVPSSGWARPPRWRYALAAAAALALMLGIVKFGARYRSDTLSYHSKSGLAGARVVQANKEPVELDFSDGTVVMVRPNTRVHVTDTTRRGASFWLESGRMEFNVVPHPDRGNWLIQAGQFQVRVTGTNFSVEWVGAEGLLHVDVTRGHVVVEGAGQRRELGPGDSFHHREPSALQSPAPAPVTSSAGEQMKSPAILEHAADQAAELSSRRAEPGGSAARSTSARAGTWSRWVAEGDFEKVLAAAAQRGVAECLRSCAQDDLWALANAARLGGKPTLAEEALMTQRSRFTGSAEATAAAFLLGRLAEDRADAGALVWYDTYLRDAPTGRFAGDVLGRKMVLVAKSDRTRALSLAREYRERFPRGPYAGHAKSLIDAASGIDGSEQRR